MQECIHRETNAASPDMHADLSTGSILMCADVLHVHGSTHTVGNHFSASTWRHMHTDAVGPKLV